MEQAIALVAHRYASISENLFCYGKAEHQLERWRWNINSRIANIQSNCARVRTQ
jgi:hypothetical protein